MGMNKREAKQHVWANLMKVDRCSCNPPNITVKKGDAQFQAREGCLTCSEWFGPVLLHWADPEAERFNTQAINWEHK